MKKSAVFLAVLVLLVASLVAPASAGAASKLRVRASAVSISKSGSPVSVKFRSKSNRRAYVRVSIYRGGKLVRTIKAKRKSVRKTLYWNLRSRSGSAVTAGTYRYKVTAATGSKRALARGTFIVRRKKVPATPVTTPTVEPTTTPVIPPTVEPTPSVDPTIPAVIVTPTPVPTPTPEPTPASRWFGYYVPGAPSSMAPLTTLQESVGGSAKVVNFFVDDAGTFPVGRCGAVRDNGSIPLITMEFWSTQNGGVAAITAGSKDAWLRTYANAAKSYGGEVWVRPFHEMNGNWYPWGGTVGSNTPAQVVAAYRHVHDIFAEQGATNVKFVWCVNNDNVPSTTANAADKYWPGDAYVDYLSIDGYNFGTSSSWSSWRTFSSVMGAQYNTVTKLSAKPLFIGETGCSEVGGNKAAWIADMYAKIGTTFPRITGVCWFNADKETDWRVESSTAALTAYKKVVAAGY